MRRALGEWTFAALITTLGLVFACDGSWMVEDAIARSVYARQPRPLGGGALVLALLVCLIGIGIHGAFGAYGVFDF